MNQSADMNLAMTLSLKDRLVAPLRQAVDQVEREFKDLERQSERTSASVGKVSETLAKVGRTASTTKAAVSDLRRLGEEAQRAEQHVSRLAAAGGRLRGMLSGAAGVVAGTTAFGMVTADPLRQAANYDTELRRLANTAYAGRPLSERRAGVGTLNNAITSAVRFGGGTRDQALSALNELVSSGAFGDVNEATGLLPLLMRGGTASGADAGQLATIAIRAKQSMGLSAAQMPQVLDMAMAAGNAGGFELKDMARWLPQQMAAARSAGMSGIDGLAALLVANQGAAITAGTKDEAGNNLVNLLSKINSSDTTADFRKQGIDLPGTLAAAAGKGMNPLQAFVALTDKLVGADPKFRAAQARMAGATGAERQAAAASQVDLLQGSVIGRVVQDRQALMALVGLMGNRDYLSGVAGKVKNSKGTYDAAAALITEGAGYVYDQRQFEAQKAQTDAMTTANGAVMKLAQAQIDLYQRYPGFASALEGAKVAVTGFTAAIAAAGGIRLLTGGLGGAAATGGGAATAGVAGGSGALGAIGGPIAAGGLALSYIAATAVASNREQFSAIADDPMASAMSGDYGIAAAIMDAADGTKAAAEAAQKAAEAAQKAADRRQAEKDADERIRELHLHLPDGRELTMSVDEMIGLEARRR